MQHPNLASSSINKMLACGLLALLADFFFYRQQVGWTIGLFCLVGLIIAFVFTPHTQWRMKCILASLTFGQCLALVEQPNTISFFLAVIGIVSTAISHNMHWHRNAVHWWSCIYRLLLGTPRRLLYDKWLISKIRMRHVRFHGKRSWLQGWLLPVLCGIIFFVLFQQANPIIAEWVGHFDLRWLGDALSAYRLLFIFLVFSVFWAILRAKFRPLPVVEEQTDEPENWISWLFSPQAIFRSLILFNLLFAAQTIMDILYLWGNAALPDGLTHAHYARRGAYPLVATALLSALFILTVYRKKDASQVTGATQGLIHLWLAQNVLLVCSSIHRLCLYIESYSLTYLRLSALIWMGIVAMGLILICVRISYRKGNRWLINSNALTVLATLYICGFMPFGQMIAHYNVLHSHGISGKGARLDIHYLQKLGPRGWEALQYYQQRYASYGPTLPAWGKRAPEEVAGLKNWRTWTFENYRIVRRIREQQAGAHP